jgi:hypothetical protein
LDRRIERRLKYLSESTKLKYENKKTENSGKDIVDEES